MDTASLELLGWPAILEHLAARASTAHGRDRCLAATLYVDARDVAHELEITNQARQLATMTNGIPLGGIADIRAALRRAEQGGTLDAAQLSDVAATLESASRLKHFLASHGESFPHMGRMAEPLSEQPHLVREIRRCIDPTGNEVKDQASAPLAEIRSRIGRLSAQVKQQVQAMVHTHAQYLQDALVTVRGDRYVLPVRAQHRNHVPGLVHDQSASGQTLFIEPMALVALNNDLQQARLDERDEIQRILETLSALVAACSWDLKATAEGLADIDFAAARAALSEAWNGHPPGLADGPPQLFQARHPLLIEACRREGRAIVPIDLVFARPAVLLSGPNTGGKTVGLETLGLCVLMTQAGIHPPVGPSSMLTVYSRVFADIGDPQNLEESLSTFSGHMKTLIRILEDTGSRTLVLLDELGAGTDPQEGAAIARAVIEELLARGSHLLATTHLAELKLLAHELDSVANASMEFDPRTLAPTYRVLMGIPGQSNALATARRLGLAERLVERARTLLESGRDDAGRLMADLMRERQELETARHAAEQARQEADRRISEQDDRLAGWKAELTGLRREAKRDLEAELDQARDEIRKVIAELKGQRTGPAAQRASERLARMKDRRSAPDSAPRSPIALAPGDAVHLPRLGLTGIIQSAPDSAGDVVIQAGQLRVTANFLELEPAGKGSIVKVSPTRREPFKRSHEQRDRLGPGQAAESEDAAYPGRELDLRGMQVHESLPAVDRFLDDSLRAGLETVFIIHGAGTGALRRAIRQALPSSPYCKKFRPGGPGEGGDGVTVVTLK